MKAGCLSPRAQAAQLGRMQGFRISAREPLIAGQSFSSRWRKSWRRAESEDLGCVMICIYYHIHTIARNRLKDFGADFPAVTEALRWPVPPDQGATQDIRAI